MQHWLDYKRENSRTYSQAFISNMYKKNGPSTCQATVVRESCFLLFKVRAVQRLQRLFFHLHR